MTFYNRANSAVFSYSCGSIDVPAAGNIVDDKLRDDASVLFAPNALDQMVWTSTNFDVNDCRITLYRGPSASGLKMGTIKLGVDGTFKMDCAAVDQGNRPLTNKFPIYCTIYSGKAVATKFGWTCKHT